MKLTLDNNCIINLHDHESSTATSVEELELLDQLARQHGFEIAITTRVEADLENDKDHSRKQRMFDIIRNYEVVGSIGRWDISKWDGGDLYSTEETDQICNEVRMIVFPGGIDPESKRHQNKQNDVDHLVGHKINGRDIFVTDDRAMLRKQEALKTSPGIVVMSPAECVEFIQQQVERRTIRPLLSERSVHGYSNTAFSGSASFDYTNNNGSYVIGHGVWLFKTKWTSAGSTAIHAYNDAPSVAGIALAKSVEEISEVRTATDLDFSSRTRTVREGQVLVLENAHGFFAAIKVEDVQYTGHGDDIDQLEFTYKIQTDGGSDFS